jgi:hypothetical protein
MRRCKSIVYIGFARSDGGHKGGASTDHGMRRNILSPAHVPSRRSFLAAIIAMLAFALLLPGSAAAKQKADHDRGHGKVVNVMTRNPSEIGLQSAAVTGLLPVNGFWDSDHAGLFSALRFAH